VRVFCEEAEEAACSLAVCIQLVDFVYVVVLCKM
jgi:hypothetical protein